MGRLTVEGIYRDGKVDLAEQPTYVTVARVMVIFLPVEPAAEGQAQPAHESAS